jgi:hypothetical protein
MAVCEFCRAAVLKDADSVRNVGKISSVLEDFSPIQMGAAGVFGGRNFTVVGRIQLRYEQGMWNEWYLLFDDTTASWLGDSSGLYTITTPREAGGPLPGFTDITPGAQYKIGDETYTASEKREAECIAGQGELPFRVGDGWRIRVADFRKGSSFITLDYTDGEIPVVYNGMSTTLEELKFQLLRADEQIKASAGRYRGKLDALDCPKCGSTINYLPGVTTNLVCPACSSQLDAAGPEATVLAVGEEVDHMLTTLQLGAKASILGSDYTVIGAMVRGDEEDSVWTEYLLYSTKGSFFWLVETDEGWSRATVLPSWPMWQSLDATSVKLENVNYTKLYDYLASVYYAAGAFNWRVAVGDEVRVYEFESGQTKLAAELTQSEMTWSRSTPVAYDQIKAWFGASIKGAAPAGKKDGASTVRSTQMKFLWWILGLNAIPIVLNFGSSFWIILIALFALFYPEDYFQGDGDKT